MPHKAHSGSKSHGQQLWLVDDVAQYLRISKDEVYRLVARRAIPHIRVFRRKGIRFHPGDVEKWARTGVTEDS